MIDDATVWGAVGGVIRGRRRKTLRFHTERTGSVRSCLQRTVTFSAVRVLDVFFGIEHGGSIFLRNVGKFVAGHRASDTVRQYPSQCFVLLLFIVSPPNIRLGLIGQ
jgi:hypothetical protein